MFFFFVNCQSLEKERVKENTHYVKLFMIIISLNKSEIVYLMLFLRKKEDYPFIKLEILSLYFTNLLIYLILLLIIKKIKLTRQNFLSIQFSLISFFPHSFLKNIDINICEVILDKKKEDDFVSQLNIERNLIEGNY